MMLDIIIPHYNEPFETGKPLFEMLAMQKGIDFEKIRVLLIHDGSEAFTDDTFKGYPYQVEQYGIEHGGVSRARNYGIDMAKAKWITFCDFDDTFSSIYSLKFVMDVLETEDFDFLWNPIFMEDIATDGRFRLFPLMKFNMIFIHNKYIRLDFLKKTGIRFNEELSYSEDSAFLAVLNEQLGHHRIGQIRSAFPLYTWAFRAGSCTTDSGNKLRNVQHLFDSNRYISEMFEKTSPENAVLMRFRAIVDAYMALTGEGCVEDPELKKKVGQYWKANRAEIEKADKEKLARVYAASYRNGCRGRENAKRPGLAEWLKEIENIS